MAACNHRKQDLDQHLVLADDGLADLPYDLFGFSNGIDGSHKNLQKNKSCYVTIIFDKLQDGE